MPELVVGTRTIRYEIRVSQRARRKRIEVSPAGVKVIAPASATPGEVRAFVDSRRRWIHDKTEEITEIVARLRRQTPEGYHSGAKLLFRGRMLRLRVERADIEQPALEYRTAFHVRVPAGTPPAREADVVRATVQRWFRERLLEDAWSFARRHGATHGLEPPDIRIRDQKTLWGSCGKDGVIRLSWKLIRVPKAVLEYVVVHELCHLRHRDHSPAFWSLLKEVLPDYEERKRWLARHDVALQ